MSFQRKFQAGGFQPSIELPLTSDRGPRPHSCVGRDELFADSWPMVILITGNKMFIRTCTECPYVHLYLCPTSRGSSDYCDLSICISLIESTS
jgi:hypothetical protein